MNWQWRLASVLLVAATFVSACGAAATPTGPVVAKLTGNDPTEDVLKNGVYDVKDLGSLTLQNGAYEKKYGDGATMVNKVGYMASAVGDLDKDGAKDAAVVLYANTGGSGTFIYLFAATNKSKTLYQAGSLLIGDRTQVKSIAIDGGKITMQTLDFAPTDPKCCPSLNQTRTFSLQAGVLVETK
jgi:hypothetical protein